MPPSAALLGFLKAKAASYEEVRKEVKTFHRLLLDVLEGPRQDSGADLIEPFFPLLRKLGAATLPLERQCLHMIYIIMCREIAPLGPDLVATSEISERWFKSISELIPVDIVVQSDLRAVVLSIRACQAICNSGRVSSFTRRRFADTLRRILFVEGLVGGMIAQLSNQHHAPSQTDHGKLWPFRTATSSKSISDYHSPEVIAVCEQSISALHSCLPESFAAVTKDESLVLVTALNQPHNPLASACLAYFSGVVHATPPLALDVARSNLFASPPTCAEHSPINARQFYEILASICRVQNNEHTNAFATLCHAVQQDDRLEVAVFVCNQLASLPWQWLVSHPDKVLTDVVYKLSTALVDKRNPALVFAACESIQRLGRCKSTANSHAEVFVPWTGKLGRLCEDQTSCPGAEAAAALAWVGNPNSDMLFRLKQCPVEYANEVGLALLERAALERNSAPLVDLVFQVLWYFDQVPPHSTHQLELALQGDLEQVVRFLDLANKVNSSEWETCLWELVIGHSQQSSPHAQRIVTKAERSLYLSGQLAVQKLAVQALAKTALLCPEQRLAAYQVLVEFAALPNRPAHHHHAWVLEDAVFPSLRALDMVFAGEEYATLACLSLGLDLPLDFDI
ncbi:hypothetical protein BASA81_001269 [Batrachochytrium salamandrivorans]|nr:hypothetical protein BASA81_001269 [Batrachochytrium salamandrivorans]